METSKKNRLGGLVCGPLLVIGGILVLWQNEGRFNYAEAAADATVLATASQQAEGPVAFTGSFDTTITLPGELVQRFPGYFHVHRHTEVYAWDREERDGRTTWSREWMDSLESNARNNGLTQQLRDRHFTPATYRVGSLEIDGEDMHFADDSVTIDPGRLQLTERARQLGLQVRGRYLYKAVGSGSPSLGDERVSFEGLVPAGTMTWFGALDGDRGRAHGEDVGGGMINALIDNDGILHHLVVGDRATALATMDAHFTRTVWIFRGVGTLVVIIGLHVFFSVFASILYAIPLLGPLAETAVGLASTALGLGVSLVVIITGWVFNHPLTVALPLGLAVAAFFYFRREQRATRANAEETLGQLLDRQGQAPASATAAQGDGRSAATGMARIEETFRHLAALALVEGDLDKREQRFLVDWGRRQGIAGDRMQALFREVRKAGEAAAATDRRDMQVLVCMALSDGVVSGREWDLLVRLGQSVGMGAKELKQVVADVRQGNLAPA